MAGASIETTLELWASSLRDVKARMRGLFTQERVAASANLFLDGLLGDERRKTGWMRAEAAGDPGPWRQKAILGHGHIVREYVVENLATEISFPLESFQTASEHEHIAAGPKELNGIRLPEVSGGACDQNS